MEGSYQTDNISLCLSPSFTHLVDAYVRWKQELEVAQMKATEDQKRLEQERLKLQEERDFVADHQLRNSNKIKLDVGGKIYATSLTTLTSDPDSMLAAMFSGRFPLKKDDDGCYFLDRDGTYFGYILEWLRDGTLPNIDNDNNTLDLRERLIREAEYYGLRLAGILKEAARQEAEERRLKEVEAALKEQGRQEQEEKFKKEIAQLQQQLEGVMISEQKLAEKISLYGNFLQALASKNQGKIQQILGQHYSGLQQLISQYCSSIGGPPSRLTQVVATVVSLCQQVYQKLL